MTQEEIDKQEKEQNPYGPYYKDSAGICPGCYGQNRAIPPGSRTCSRHGKNYCPSCGGLTIYSKKYDKFHCPNIACKEGIPTCKVI